MAELKQLIGEVFSSSEIIKAISKLTSTKPSVLFADQVRKLSQEEIRQLKEQGNFAQDWAEILVTDGFNPRRIYNANFFGRCIVGSFKEPKVAVDKGLIYPSGIYNSTIVNSEIGDDSLIMNVGSLSHYVVSERAVLFNLNTVLCEEGTVFGNGVELPLAIETGGREVKTYGEITIAVAARLATSRGDKELLSDYEQFIGEYLDKVRSSKGVIEKRAVVRNCSKITNVFVGEAALIDNATKVENVSLLSNAEEPTRVTDGAYVVNSILQWGCEVGSMAIVDSSVMTEHSHVERHGKLTQSVLGPNSGVAEGEITASLVGPFVGFHHQALLIAAYWPEGKGNVGYGANVGSNHTAKAPDQEIWCGEGTFFGLGVNIKFPSNFHRAPYSIIATAVNALPQKIEFPFSLINTPAAVYPDMSPAINEIMPGWVLSDNIFMIRRNEGKYHKRNKARRSQFEFEVLRPDIVDMMIEARNRLVNITEKKDIYTDKDINGLGKNYMSEWSRIKGIEAYSFYIQYYVLLGLKRRVEQILLAEDKKSIKNIYESHTDDARWEHERNILVTELHDQDVKGHLQLLADYQQQIAEAVEASKEKDDKRGQRVIDDYAEAHTAASEDKFVQETWEVTNKLRQEIDELLTQINF